MLATIVVDNTRQLFEAINQITGRDAVVTTKKKVAVMGCLASAYWDGGNGKLVVTEASSGVRTEIPFGEIVEVNLARSVV